MINLQAFILSTTFLGMVIMLRIFFDRRSCRLYKTDLMDLCMHMICCSFRILGLEIDWRGNQNFNYCSFLRNGLGEKWRPMVYGLPPIDHRNGLWVGDGDNHIVSSGTGIFVSLRYDYFHLRMELKENSMPIWQHYIYNSPW